MIEQRRSRPRSRPAAGRHADAVGPGRPRAQGTDAHHARDDRRRAEHGEADQADHQSQRRALVCGVGDCVGELSGDSPDHRPQRERRAGDARRHRRPAAPRRRWPALVERPVTGVPRTNGRGAAVRPGPKTS